MDSYDEANFLTLQEEIDSFIHFNVYVGSPNAHLKEGISNFNRHTWLPQLTILSVKGNS